MEKPFILLVDDNPKNLQVLGNLLEGTYKTAVAENGVEALEFVKKKVPDLILLDIMMPEMDGFEFCQRLKADPDTRDISIIFLTALTEKANILKGFELGAVDYVIKPFRKEELLVRVKNRITLRHSQKQLEEQNLQLQQEITERKAAEIALREQKTVLNTIFDHAPIVMILVNTEGRVENINYTGVQTIGRPKEEVLGLLGGQVFQCVNSFSQGGCSRGSYCERCPVRNTVMETFRTGNGFHKVEGELTVMTDHGTITHHLLISTTYLNFHDGEKVLLSLDDITERKQMEEALTQERNLLQTLIDNVPDLIYVKDTGGRFLLVNKANMRSLGADMLEDIMGKTDFDFFPKELSEQYSADERAIFTSGQPLVNHEEPYVEPQTGATRWFLTTKVPFHDSQGNIIGLVGINHDITVRKQAEEQLKQAKEELEELNVNKDKFFSIIAHDLRSPLGALHSLSEIIVENIEGYGKDKLIQFLTIQRDAAKNLLALLENLLTWSRIQRGMIEFSPHQIEVGDIITQNIALFTQNAEQKQITFQSSIPEKTSVYADFSMVNTVVRNLISNALKFTDSGGMITVSVRQDNTCIKVSVSDTGIGIDAKHLSKLFHIDAKYQRKGTANEQGTGLGLILCKEFVKRNGGKIWVKSEVGKGTTFTFTLPLPQNSSSPSLQSARFENF